MLQTVTISSKRQITIPSSVFSHLQLSEGDTLVAEIDDNSLRLHKSSHILNALAGSIHIPKQKQHLSIEDAIKQAPKKYFSKRKHEKDIY